LPKKKSSSKKARERKKIEEERAWPVGRGTECGGPPVLSLTLSLSPAAAAGELIID
jgi:hypothetical protein